MALLLIFPRNINICIYFGLLMIIGNASGRKSSHHRRSIHDDELQSTATESNILTIIVDQSANGNGNFSTIQSAIDSIPDNNDKWICIYIKAGTYNEQVMIPDNKPMIYLKGQGRDTTNVISGNPGIDSGATFRTHAHNIVARDLSFTNSYNYPIDKNQNSITPATAALIEGDNSAFYDCGFYGFQDTLWDVKGRHNFYGCTIVGAVDFIMGAAQSIYENCRISVISKALDGTPGYITAQSREDPNDGSGFVFKYCTVEGDGPTYLGRPWREYARVLFYGSSLSDIIVPKGWDAMNNSTNVYLTTFAEHGCNGTGADTSNRVEWEKQLNEEWLHLLTSISFIDNQGWIKRQPFYILP